ncbi:type VII secretion-associated serine protease mycosin [Streptomyces sp. NPDC059092]|uniref:type VII secretion-associated serine protease mycosin n=1 Tax=Streptomyces sp. NPDC059092 TaxID=3346725 RepID=UPI003694EBC4
MRIGSRSRIRSRTAIAAALGILLAGAATAPAQADSIRSQQWHLDTLGAENIWKVSTGKGVTVAVIDTGVDDTNPDLLGQVINGTDLASGESGDEHSDYKGHGTGISAIIAGTGKSGGGDGAFGMAPGAKILPIRMPNVGWDANRDLNVKQFNTSVSTAIRYAADSGAKVINISMATREGSQRMTDAVKYALDKGSLVFAATGNDGDSSLSYPAATPGVLGVGAVGKDLKKTEQSQWGPAVDFAAPGKDIVHACAGATGLCKSTGTSDATAIASASAALIWSKHPEWTNNQLLRAMLNTAGGPTSGNKRNDYVGYGAIRPLRAINTPGDLGPADEYPLPDLLAAGSKSPSPAAEASEAAGSAADDKEDAKEPAAASDGGGNTGLWIGVGVGAAVLLGGAVAVAVVRSRRRAAAASAAPAPAYAPYPQQQPPYPPAYAPPQPGQGQVQGDPRNAPPGPGL